jgi:hypothetical protein
MAVRSSCTAQYIECIYICMHYLTVTKHNTKIFCVWYFLEVYQTGHPRHVPNANKTPTTNKTRIHITPTTSQLSTNLATSSKQPWQSFWMQTAINHSNNGLLNTEILILHVLHFFSLVDCCLAAQIANFIWNALNVGGPNSQISPAKCVIGIRQ